MIKVNDPFIRFQYKPVRQHAEHKNDLTSYGYGGGGSGGSGEGKRRTGYDFFFFFINV